MTGWTGVWELENGVTVDVEVVIGNGKGNGNGSRDMSHCILCAEIYDAGTSTSDRGPGFGSGSGPGSETGVNTSSCHRESQIANPRSQIRRRGKAPTEVRCRRRCRGRATRTRTRTCTCTYALSRLGRTSFCLSCPFLVDVCLSLRVKCSLYFASPNAKKARWGGGESGKAGKGKEKRERNLGTRKYGRRDFKCLARKTR